MSRWIRPFAWPLLGVVLGSVGVTSPRALSAEPHPLAAPDNVQLHPDLEISLFAREPDVVDPVGLTFDEFGRAYVVEMRDYPYGFGPDHQPGGTVRRLEDTDGDGRADRSTLFAEHLSFPTSITAWNGGVLVTAPPDIVFLKDTDGDGRADVRQVVVAGFRLAATDSNVSGLRYGPDGWIHGVNGGNGGSLQMPQRAGEPIRLGDRDFRFRPDAGVLEVTTHTGGGFGLVFDAWGQSFTPHNVNHVQQRVADVAAVSRHAGLPAFETTHSISDHGDMARIYSISTAQTRPNHPEQAGYFSSSGGMGWIGHRDWPGDMPGSLLVGDVVGNLVHRDVLTPNGPILRASRAAGEQTREFFASRDPAFRPTGFELGPDGALYLLDMQRDVIEHPDYIPKKLLAKLDVRAGEDRGRIYRLAPKGWPRARELPGNATPAQQAEMLRSPNGWTRQTAQRVLIAAARRETIPALNALAGAEAGNPSEETRIAALQTLDGLDALDDAVLRATRDRLTSSGALEAWLRLAERHGRDRRSLADVVLAHLRHPEPAVRFRAAIAAGSVSNSPLAAALTTFLARDGTNRWMRRAGLSSLPPGGENTALDTLLAAAKSADANQVPPLAVLHDLAELAGAQPLPATPADAVTTWSRWSRWLVASSGNEAVTLAVLGGLHQGLSRVDAMAHVPEDEPLTTELRRLLDPGRPRVLNAAWRLARRLGLPDSPAQQAALLEAARTARDSTAGLERRLAALELLDLGEASASIPIFLELLDSRFPQELRREAFNQLRDHREPAVGEGLIRAWPTLPPAFRPDVVNLLVYRHAFHPALLTALDGGTLTVGELNLDLEHRRELLWKAAPEIRTRAARHVSDGEYSNRGALVDQWLAKLPAGGEAARGRPVFERLCSPCHRVQSVGLRVGPELTGMSHRSVEDLLSNILDPNMAMNPAFVAYTAELTDGEQEIGLLAAETADAVTLLQAQEHAVVIPRARIKSLRASGRSLMPEGLEAGLTPAELRDVIAFLQEPAPEPKNVYGHP